MSAHNCLVSTRFEIDFLRRGIVLDKRVTPTDGSVCAICQHSLADLAPAEFSCCGGYAREFVCGHIFHIGCFINLLLAARKMVCPVCRTDFFATHILGTPPPKA